ncbi:hypothetical protein [Coleofasciculus sp. E2-BRE-01]|uniref:hypothetical protein n=1 Tax=Coleofasciculus sp. E2-BRE-01 TaxID=3069524 RepID=UPI0033026435
MARIAISNLFPTHTNFSLDIGELDNSEMKAVTGGFVVTVPVGIAIGSAFLTGVGIGVTLYGVIKD